MAIEDLLREAAAKGLTHLTIWPTPSEDGKKLYWTARATPSTAHSYVQNQNLDPVEALTAVLKSLPKAPKREPKKITATVKEPPPGHTDLMVTPEAISAAPEPLPDDENNGDLSQWLPKT